MPCYNPLTAFRCGDGKLAFNERNAARQGRDVLSTQLIRCGQCIGCLLENSRQWATRCMHEAQMHTYNSFLTLTYDEQHLPEHNFLDHRHYQLFMKKLREATASPPRPSGEREGGAINNNLAPRNSNILCKYAQTAPQKARGTVYAIARYFMAGEYGETYGRPHFHSCLFGIAFNDRTYYTTTPAGYPLYKSATLDKLWGNGFATIGDLTFESAAYAARYQLKKAGQKQGKYTEIINIETGEILKRPREYQKMSRNPGIGLNWLNQYYTDVYPRGKVIVRAQPSTAPRYYDNQAKKLYPQAFEDIQYGRHVEAIAHHQEQTPERLRARLHVAKAKIQFLKRNKEFT